MTERWPGYHRGVPPPGADARLVQRPHRFGAWRLEVTWDGQEGWHDLGTVSEYFGAGINWVDLLQWGAIADDLDPVE